MTQVIKITGKAKDVFARIAYLAQVAGKVTLQELVWSKGVIAKGEENECIGW